MTHSVRLMKNQEKAPNKARTKTKTAMSLPKKTKMKKLTTVKRKKNG